MMMSPWEFMAVYDNGNCYPQKVETNDSRLVIFRSSPLYYTNCMHCPHLGWKSRCFLGNKFACFAVGLMHKSKATILHYHITFIALS